MSKLRNWFRPRRSDAPGHHIVRERYDAFNDGMLSVSETAAYETHLRTCVECQQWVAQQRGLIANLRADMPPTYQLPPSGAVQIQQAIYKQIKRKIFMENVKLSLRTITAVAAVIIVAGVVLWWQFGRSDQPASPAETELSATALPEVETDEVLPLTFAAPAAQRSRYELIAALYNSLNPDVMVRVISLAPDSDPATQADTAVLPSSTTDPANFIDLANWLGSSASINPQDYFAGALEACQVGETVYGLPLSFSPSYIYFDQAVLVEAGVFPPNAEWTWPDLVQAITALSTGDGTRYGFGNVDGLLRLLRPLLVANLDTDGNFNTAALEPYFQDIANLVAAGHVANVPDAELETLILDGRIGFWLDNPATLSPRVAEIGDTLGRLPIPHLGDLTSINSAEADCLAISRGSSQPEAAWRWLQYLAYNPPDLPAGSLPANRLVTNGFADDVLPSDDVSVVAISRVWFSRQRRQVDSLIPALRQHVVAGVPLDEAMAQAVTIAETETEAPVIAEPPEQAGPVTIRFFGDESRLADAISTFQAAHPDIRVDVSFNVQVGADEFFMDNVAEQFDCFDFSALTQMPPNIAELVWDISDLVSADTLADYMPELLALIEVDGRLYGLPSEINPIVVRYNETRFSQTGVPIPTADWTLNDLLNTAAQLGQTGDSPVYGFAATGFGSLSGPEFIEVVLAEQGIQLWDLSAGTMNVADPAVTAVFNQYLTWMQQNALYTSAPGDGYEVRNAFTQNGGAAMWLTTSDRRPFAIGVPEPFAMLPLPQLNSQLLPSPWQTLLFISSRVADPSACMTWIEFLTTRADAMTAVPARQSVANSRAWENEVGPENAAVFRQALTRHLSASSPEASLLLFGTKYPLYRWLQQAAETAVAGGDSAAQLLQAQTWSEAYLACIGNNTNATAEEIQDCAVEADPNYMLGFDQ